MKHLYSEVPPLDTWLSDTYLLTKPRSKELKALDAAIGEFHSSSAGMVTRRAAVSAALKAWQAKAKAERGSWAKSERNQKGAVQALDFVLHHVVTSWVMDPDHMRAVRAVRAAQVAALRTLFAGKQFQMKLSGKAHLPSQAASALSSVKSGVQKIRSGGATSADFTGSVSSATANLRTFLTTLCGGDASQASAIMGKLGVGSIEKVAADIAPFVGLISSGGKCVIGWIGVAKKAWDESKLLATRRSFAPGDPAAAFDAAMRLVHEELNAAKSSAGIATAAFGGKALGTFADGGAISGPVVGILETLANFIQTVFLFAREYRRAQEANEVLRSGDLGLKLFQASPLAGCYYLVVGDTSTVLAIAVADWGKDGWVLEVDRMRKQIEPVLSKCSELVRASHFEIPEFARMKGVVAPSVSWTDKLSNLPAKLLDSIRGPSTPHVDPKKLKGIANPAFAPKSS